MTVKDFGTNVPALDEITDAEKELYVTLDTLIKQYTEHMEAIEFRKSLSDLREIWVSGNNYIAKTEPWKAVKVDKARAGTILNTGLNLIHLFGVLSAPVMPTKAKEMLTLFGKGDFSWPTDKAENLLKTLKEGDSFVAPEPLFQKITPERKEELKIKYKEGV